jgi:hypothetical protein
MLSVAWTRTIDGPVVEQLGRIGIDFEAWGRERALGSAKARAYMLVRAAGQRVRVPLNKNLTNAWAYVNLCISLPELRIAR